MYCLRDRHFRPRGSWWESSQRWLSPAHPTTKPRVSSCNAWDLMGSHVVPAVHAWWCRCRCPWPASWDQLATDMVGSMLISPSRSLGKTKKRPEKLWWFTASKHKIFSCRRDLTNANSVSNRIPIPFSTDPKSQDIQNITKLIMLIKSILSSSYCHSSPVFSGEYMATTTASLPPIAPPSLRLSTRAVCVLKRSSSNNFSALASGAAWLLSWEWKSYLKMSWTSVALHAQNGCTPFFCQMSLAVKGKRLLGK